MKSRFLIVSLIFLTCLANNSFGQEPVVITDTLEVKDSTNKTFINDDILYDASDSMHFNIVNKKVFLYGDAFIKYENTEIKEGIL